MPTGIVYVDGDLYVSEVNRVLKFIDIDQNFRKNPKGEPINFTFPSDEHHGWKYLGYGPDKKLYVPVGAPCNICEEENPVYASIIRMNLDGTDAEIFASGIRNTVGFAWHPKTNELWFTDNGRDWMGDDIPPCELNHAPEKGLHFGYPYCHGSDVIDPDFGKGKNCNDYKKPVQDLGPHVAPLGMKFYTGKSFPKEYHNQVFIAEHGSWNRSKPIGYRISLVRLEGNKAVSYETFAEGWLNEDGSRWGRPVDILILNDGSMLVSDDFGDAIYRISYK
jgi:glucose/arabinose dehydrogenase